MALSDRRVPITRVTSETTSDRPVRLEARQKQEAPGLITWCFLHEDVHALNRIGAGVQIQRVIARPAWG
jgi:hypothetical protein